MSKRMKISQLDLFGDFLILLPFIRDVQSAEILQTHRAKFGLVLDAEWGGFCFWFFGLEGKSLIRKWKSWESLYLEADLIEPEKTLLSSCLFRSLSSYPFNSPQQYSNPVAASHPRTLSQFCSV
jgi:hypothetical protein